MTLTTTPPPAASDDLELLWEYGRSRSTMAFQTVADRYIDLIYSAALRQVRDSHVAGDVTQAVLIVMMNKAATLPPRTVLAAWLLLKINGWLKTNGTALNYFCAVAE
jgi:hypothetical protein